jgi:hypothetical protein
MSKIIYLIEQPLDDWNYDRFGIQTWINRGWKVEVWDVTPLLQPRVWQSHIELAGKLKAFNGYFPIASNSQLEQRYSGAGKIDYFIDFAGDTYTSLRIKLRLVKLGAIRVICAIGSIPVPGGPEDSGVVRKLRKAFAVGPIKSLKLLTNALMLKVIAPSIRAGLTVVSGESSVPSVCGRDDQRIIKAHNLDYDIYTAIKKSLDRSAGEYAVFVDQDYCFHPEYIYQDAPAAVTPEKYFPAICKGLRTISHALGVDLRIAAHPRAGYQQRIADYFEGIPIEYGRTAELIGNCKVAVCHDSTAIQLAVLFGKPVIFVTTDELNSVFFDSSFKSESITSFASALGKSVINLDSDLNCVNWKKELSVDSTKYAEYRNRYIKIDGSPEIPHWDIVITHIENAVRRTSPGALEQVKSVNGNS